MKRKSVLLMATLALTLLLAGTGQAFVLSGTNLDVGVSDGGGLVDIPAKQGITFNPGPLPNDFSYPGTPFEFVSISINGAYQTSGVNGASVNPWGLTTTNVSASGTLQANSTMAAYSFNGQKILYSQAVVFDMADKEIDVTMKIKNLSADGSTLKNVYISRGMDPDQDVLKYGTFETNNVIPGKFGSQIMAVGPKTGLYVDMKDNTFFFAGVPAISGINGGIWSTDPLFLGAGGLVNGALAGNPRDYSINMTWFLGDIGYDESRTIDFDYRFGTVPVPPSVWLFGSGLLGLVGLRRKLFKA